MVMSLMGGHVSGLRLESRTAANVQEMSTPDA